MIREIIFALAVVFGLFVFLTATGPAVEETNTELNESIQLQNEFKGIPQLVKFISLSLFPLLMIVGIFAWLFAVAALKEGFWGGGPKRP